MELKLAQDWSLLQNDSPMWSSRNAQSAIPQGPPCMECIYTGYIAYIFPNAQGRACNTALPPTEGDLNPQQNYFHEQDLI